MTQLLRAKVWRPVWGVAAMALFLGLAPAFAAAPTAVNDNLSDADEDSIKTIASATLLANDTGTGMGISAVSSPTIWGATVTLSGGTITYDPRNSATAQGIRAGTFGSDSFTYTVTNSDGFASATVSFHLNGRNDLPQIAGAVRTQMRDDTATNLFDGLTVSDVDVGDTITATITLNTVQIGSFQGHAGQSQFDLTGSASAVTTALQALRYVPTPNRVAPGLTESFTATLEVHDASAGVSPGNSTTTVTVTSIADAPSVAMEFVWSTRDDQVGFPLYPLVVNDPDPDASSQTYELRLLTSPYGHYDPASVPSSRVDPDGSIVITNYTRDQIIAPTLDPVRFVPEANVGGNYANGDVRQLGIVVTDSHGSAITSSVPLRIVPVNDLPNIAGIPPNLVRVNDDATVRPFDKILISDVDETGTQHVSVTISFAVGTNPPAPGSFPVGGGLSGSLQTNLQGEITAIYALASGSQASVQAFLRNLVFTPTPNLLPVGETKTIVFTVTVTDSGGKSRSNAKTQLAITSINGAPEITTTPEPPVQPFPVSPRSPIQPFRALGVVVQDDDTNLTLTVALDQTNKGTLYLPISGTNAFTGVTSEAGLAKLTAPAHGLTNGSLVALFAADPFYNGVFAVQVFDANSFTIARPFSPTAGTSGSWMRLESFQSFAGSPADVTTALRSLVFAVNPAYLFPPDAPGGTAFTIKAEDTILNSGTRTLAITLQEAPRNWLVTRGEDDTEPGSLRYVLNRIEDNREANAVITFALPSYPALIRLTNTLVLNRNVILKGPGADLLSLSGDEDDNGKPDHQIFRVLAAVTLEGLTLTRGLGGQADDGASSGGAVYVGATGKLLIRYCTLSDCQAAQWGGAVDVNLGSLRIENSLLRGNATAAVGGLGGGAVSLYTDQTCEFVNTTFSANLQRSAAGFGGGALYAENSDPIAMLPVTVEHCTFAENQDAAGGGSSIHANVFGTLVAARNSIFADQRGKNLEVSGAGEIISDGGNISDDATRTILTQGGQPKDIYLLDQASDQTNKLAKLDAFAGTLRPTGLYPLLSGSSAISLARTPTELTDQRGGLRDAAPDSGAAERVGTLPARVVINEIHFDPQPGEAQFVELYVLRDSAPVDLSGYSLWVDGTNRHTFAASTTIQPGRGLIIANKVIAAGSVENPTTVVTNALLLQRRGAVELRSPAPDLRTILRVAYVGQFVDPLDELNESKFRYNSVTLAPQFLGFAYVPHQIAAAPPLGGANANDSGLLTLTSRTNSPGRDTGNTPFGSPNAFPVANADSVLVGEDTGVSVDVLANDLDADGFDRLVVVDVSAGSSAGTGSAITNHSVKGAEVRIDPATLLRGGAVVYDPRKALALQQLPEGAEATDEFYYEILDLVTGPITGIQSANAGAAIRFSSPAHRLVPGERIVVSGAPIAAYNGAQAVSGTNDSSFVLPVAFNGGKAITEFQTTNGGLAVVVISANHGLADSGRVVISGAGLAAYNAEHQFTRLSANAFLIPVAFGGNPVLKGSWAPVPDGSWIAVTATGPVQSFQGTAGNTPVTVRSAANSLVPGDRVLISGAAIDGYNGDHTITRIDADNFSVPIAFRAGRAVEAYLSTNSGAAVLVVSTNHGLAAAGRIQISGSGTAAYNGERSFTRVSTNAFLLQVAFAGNPGTKGSWSPVDSGQWVLGARGPTERSEARVSITVLGANDPPVPVADTVATDEETIIRIMGDPGLVGTSTAFDTDAQYPQRPQIFSPVNLLQNDGDPDTDDDAASLKIVGVLGSVNAIAGFGGSAGVSPVTVSSPNHGLADGVEILIAGYSGHPSYNGFHRVTVIDANSFSIPVAFVDDDTVSKGNWAVLNDANRLQATSQLGADVKLEIRNDRVETSIVYNPRASAYLNGLGLSNGVPELADDRFFYAVQDSHGAIGLAPVTVRVSGVNDLPVPANDPSALAALDSLVSSSNGLAQVLAQLKVQYFLPPASGAAHRADARVQAVESSASFALDDLWTTDEDTALNILSADLVRNDTDVDRVDQPILGVQSVSALSHEGAALTLSADRKTITYNPATSASLNQLAREEVALDSFFVTVTDGANGTVTNLVAVMVVGVNDTPKPVNDVASTPEDVLLVLGTNGNSVLKNDVEDDINGVLPDNELNLIPVTNVLTGAGANAAAGGKVLIYDPRQSAFLNGLAQGQTFVDSYRYTVADGSFLFANDDLFRVRADGANFVLGVLANDRNLNEGGSGFHIVGVGTPSRGGIVNTNTADTVVNGEVLAGTPGTLIVYTPQVNFVGDEVFTYTIADEEGNIDQALVTVRVTVDQLNGNLQANTDHFTVAKGQTALLDVLANDNLLPESGASLTITRILAPSNILARVSLAGGQLQYTPDSSFTAYPTNESFSYEISGGGTARAIASVTVVVVNREGKLDVRDDAFSLLADSLDNPLDVLANDNILPGSTAALSIQQVSVPPAHGSVAINPAGKGLLYTPAAGFAGQDTLTYVATDGLGGSGTGTVQITVGSLTTANDFFAVAYDDPNLGADDGSTELDVLANDRMQQSGASTNLVIVSVTPQNAALGTMTIRNPDHTRLLFNPAAGQQGEQDFTYAISDGFGRSATGKVTVVVVTEGVAANPDYFSVARSSVANELNVLGNDAAIPNLGRKLTIAAIGGGLDAPNHGGTVTINEANDRLLYSPAAGFTGEETFTYTVTDSRRSDTAKVVIRVTAGELSANSDAFTVFYEQPVVGDGPRQFTLPVLGNDRILPDLGQLLSITGVGIDDINATNAPNQRGGVQISADGTSLTYTPGQTNGFPYTERFTYEISDGTAQRAQAVVIVTVQERTNVRDLETDDDAYRVAQDSQRNVLLVLVNDGVKPASAAGWTITGIPQTPANGIVSVSGASLLYTPKVGFVGTDHFTYAVSDNLGGTGTGEVAVKVGDLSLLDDQFTALSGTTNNVFDVLANDAIRPATPATFKLLDAYGTDQNGTLAFAAGTNGSIFYTPSPTYAGGYPYVEAFSYRVADDSGGSVTGRVAVTVHRQGSDRSNAVLNVTVVGVNDPPTISGAQSGFQINDKQTIAPFTNVVITEVDSHGLELLKNVTVSLDDPDKGELRLLQEIGGFIRTAPGVYTMSGLASDATASLRGMVFVPRENRPKVPLTATVRFTISVSDPYVTSPVTDSTTTVLVTATNDAPTITGTQAGQKVYAHLSLAPLAGVTIGDVDDDHLQPQAVTVTLDQPFHGFFTNLGGFVAMGNGAYTVANLTPAQATAALRGLIFVPTPGNRLSPGGSETTRLTLAVNDGFAAPVVDAVTTVVSMDSFVKALSTNGIPASANFGFSVAALRDLVVVGAPTDNGAASQAGASYLFSRHLGTNDSWAQLRKLQAGDGATGDQFGYAATISGDTIVVGAPMDTHNGIRSGSVYLFERNTNGPNAWGQSKKLVPGDVAAGDEFGVAVSLHGDTLIVGAHRHRPGARRSGAAYVFGRNQGAAGAWGLVRKLTPSDGADNDDFGVAVALAGDTAVVGAQFNNGSVGSKAGAAYVFDRNLGGADQWGQTNRIAPADGVANANFGHSVAHSGDLILVGAPGDGATGSGSAYAFARNQGGAGRWGQVNKFAQFDAVDTDERFGFSVTLDGELMAIGSRLDSNATHPQGAVYVFARNHPGVNQWSLRERIAPLEFDGSVDDGFVCSLSQNTLAVGARITANQNGGAYIYRLKFGNAPYVAQPIPDQHVGLSNFFSFSIAGTFADSDAADALTLSLLTTPPSPLPPWPDFSFDPLAATFHGVPVGALGTFPVRVQATDADGASAIAGFNIVVEPESPAARDNWYSRYFSPADLAVPALEATLWGDDADPDGDGVSNLREYLFGSNPMQANPGDRSPVRIEQGPAPGALTVIFNRRTDDPRLQYVLEASANAADWQAADAFQPQASESQLADGLARVNLQLQLPDSPEPLHFFRVRVRFLVQ